MAELHGECDRCGCVDTLTEHGPQPDAYEELCALCLLAVDLDDLQAELSASSVDLSPVFVEQMHTFGESYRRALANGERDAAMSYGLGLQRLYYSALYAS